MQATRRRFLGSLGASMVLPALVGPATAQAPRVAPRPHPRPASSPAEMAGALLRQASLPGAVSWLAADLASGQPIAGHAPLRMHPPASVTKTVTALYALAHLGAGHRFETRLLATGPVKDGTLHGDLILAGGGDPTLDSDTLAALAGELATRGVRRVAGAFHVWDGALPRIAQIDPDQPPEASYNPTVSGLALNFNRVWFGWEHGNGRRRLSLAARAARHRPAVQGITIRPVPRAWPVYALEQQARRESWTVAAQALGRRGGRWLPVRHPALYAGETFVALARAAGLRLPAPQRIASLPGRARPLLRHASAELSVIIADMLRYSTNLTAEMLGLQATLRRGVQARSLARSAHEMTAWARGTLGLRRSHWVDHSGLGAASRTNAAELVQLLRTPRAREQLAPLLKTIPCSEEVEARAKTGTLAFVSALAGYAEGPTGRPIAFAVLCSDLARREKLTPKERARPPGNRAWVRRARRFERDLVALLASGH